MLKSLEGKTVIVTGASKGIGRGIAKRFGRAGLNVLVVSRHLDEAENFVFGAGYATEVMEPFIILSGKGLTKKRIAEGVRITTAFQLKQSEEYFERLAKCGLPERRERSRLWKMVELAKQSAAA